MASDEHTFEQWRRLAEEELRGRPVDDLVWHTAEGIDVPVRIYDPTRTIVDLMRLRHRLGEPTAHAALQRYLRRRDARSGVLLRLAGALDVYGPVRRALDVASAG